MPSPSPVAFRPRRVVAGLLASLVAACAGGSSNWARQAQRVHDLDGLVRVSLPEPLALDDRITERTADWVAYHFRRHYRSHLNGQSSWSETLSLVVFAPDLPRDRLDALLAQGRPRLHELGWGRTPGQGSPDARGLRWLANEQVYERDPVREPSHYVRMDDRAAGIVVGWRGFTKDYTLEDARRNLAAVRDGIAITGDLARDFATRRSWPTTGWEAPYAANLRVAAAVLAAAGVPLEAKGVLARRGPWRVFLDDERPQRLHVARFVASEPRPDAPFGLPAPMTMYRFMQETWVEDNQGSESGRLPEAARSALATDFTDRGRIWFYRVAAVDLWRDVPEATLAAELRRALRETADAAARFAQGGIVPRER